MGDDALRRKRLVIPLVLAVVLLADAGRSVLSQELQAGSVADASIADASIADAGQTPDALGGGNGGPPPEEGGGGCGCSGLT